MSDELILETSTPLLAPSIGRIQADSGVDIELKRDLAMIPDKMAFRIGEVAKLVGVKAYVLRYWETEFAALKPKKSKTNQRMYERKDVETLMLIKKLLYRDRFSIEGARGALGRLKQDTKEVKKIAQASEKLESSVENLEDLIDQIRCLSKLFA